MDHYNTSPNSVTTLSSIPSEKIITDECPKKLVQIDMAREIYFKNDLRIRYGFHLVRIDWIYHVIEKNFYPSSVGVFYDDACNHLKD